MAIPILAQWRKAAPTQRTLFLIGAVLLVLWAALWGDSLAQNRLRGARHTWVPAWTALGLDFLNVYHAANHWLHGGDPYTEPFNDPIDRPICYPPLVLPVFAWCGLLTPRKAVAVWTVALAVFAAAGAFCAWRVRRRLELSELPLVFVVAAVLCSAPVLFALERGNWDLLVLVPLIGMAWALRERSLARDGTAAACLTLAVWIKLYPVVLVLAFLACRRYRAAAIFAALTVGLTLLYLPQLPHVLANLSSVSAFHKPTAIFPVSHSLSGNWPFLWPGKFAFLRRIPGTVAACCLLLPLMLWVSYRLRQTPAQGKLLFPYLLWMTAAATFLPTVAYDYNLFFLPLAILAVWDRRDSVAVHVALGLVLIWWQPKVIQIEPYWLFWFKLAGLATATHCLLCRVAEVRAAAVDAGTMPSAQPQRMAA
jgi:hypothetical protein